MTVQKNYSHSIEILVNNCNIATYNYYHLRGSGERNGAQWRTKVSFDRTMMKSIGAAVAVVLYCCFTVTSTEGLQQHVLQP